MSHSGTRTQAASNGKAALQGQQSVKAPHAATETIMLSANMSTAVDRRSKQEHHIPRRLWSRLKSTKRNPAVLNGTLVETLRSEASSHERKLADDSQTATETISLRHNDTKNTDGQKIDCSAHSPLETNDEVEKPAPQRRSDGVQPESASEMQAPSAPSTAAEAITEMECSNQPNTSIDPGGRPSAGSPRHIANENELLREHDPQESTRRDSDGSNSDSDGFSDFSMRSDMARFAEEEYRRREDGRSGSAAVRGSRAYPLPSSEIPDGGNSDSDLSTPDYRATDPQQSRNTEQTLAVDTAQLEGSTAVDEPELSSPLAPRASQKDQAIFDTRMKPAISYLILHLTPGSREQRRDNIVFRLAMIRSYDGDPKPTIHFTCNNGDRKRQIEQLMSSRAFRGLLLRYPQFDAHPSIHVDPTLSHRSLMGEDSHFQSMINPASTLPTFNKISDDFPAPPSPPSPVPPKIQDKKSKESEKPTFSIPPQPYHPNPFIDMPIPPPPPPLGPPPSHGNTVDVVLDPECRTLMGTQILDEVPVLYEDGSTKVATLASTCGGLIYVGDNLYALTVAHNAWKSRAGRIRPSDGIDPWQLDYPPRRFGEAITHAYFSESMSYYASDWMIMAVQPELLKPNVSSKSSMPSLPLSGSRLCAIEGPRGAQNGELLPDALTLTLDKTQISVYQLIPGAACEPGDSGSWVLLDDDEVFGAVIAAADNPPVVYVQPLGDILKDISQAFSKMPVRLPTDLENEVIGMQADVLARGQKDPHTGSSFRPEEIERLVTIALRHAWSSSSRNESGPRLPPSTYKGQNFQPHHSPALPTSRAKEAGVNDPGPSIVTDICRVPPVVRALLIPRLLEHVEASGSEKELSEIVSSEAGENLFILASLLAGLCTFEMMPLVLVLLDEDVNLSAGQFMGYSRLQRLVAFLEAGDVEAAFKDTIQGLRWSKSKDAMSGEDAPVLAKNLALLASLADLPSRGTLYVYKGPFAHWYYNYAALILELPSRLWAPEERLKVESEGILDLWTDGKLDKEFPRLHFHQIEGAREQAAWLVHEPIVEALNDIYPNRSAESITSKAVFGSMRTGEDALGGDSHGRRRPGD